jgi:ABC-type dipeptide/oligopeptide/nickel transport system permease subunit
MEGVGRAEIVKKAGRMKDILLVPDLDRLRRKLENPPPLLAGLYRRFRARLDADAEFRRHHIFLPALTLALNSLGLLLRQTRASMLFVLSHDYVRTARAKGLPEQRVIGSHALRNALIPLVTVLGIQFGRLLGGAVIVEAVFAWPGLGTLVESRGSWRAMSEKRRAASRTVRAMGPSVYMISRAGMPKA